MTVRFEKPSIEDSKTPAWGCPTPAQWQRAEILSTWVNVELWHQVLRHLIIVLSSTRVRECVGVCVCERETIDTPLKVRKAPVQVGPVFTSGVTNLRLVTEIISGVKWLSHNSKCPCTFFHQMNWSHHWKKSSDLVDYKQKKGMWFGIPTDILCALQAPLSGFDLKSQCKGKQLCDEEQVWFSEKSHSWEVLIHCPACDAPDDAEILGNDRSSLRFIAPSPLYLIFARNHSPLLSRSTFNSTVHEKRGGKIVMTACSSLVCMRALYTRANKRACIFILFSR